MHKSFLVTAVAMLFSLGVKAQINLVGAANNLQTGKIDIVKWEALDAGSLTVFPSVLDGYFFATSAFDAYNSNYYLTGVSGNTAGLYSFNTISNAENLVGGSLYTNISEFDMGTGKMYNLKMEPEEYINVYEFDINANQDSLIGVIHEPGVNGIVADAIGFDANNGILYYVGFTSDPALCLYAIPVRDSVFSFTKTILNPAAPYNNITSVNFDNVNGIIYARNATYDSTYTYTGSSVVEINKTTGDIIVRGELTEFPYFVGGSSSFDQNTGTFLLVGIDTSNALKMIAFNTYDNTYVAGFVPDNVSEIVCDNTIFARDNYITTTDVKPAQALNFHLYPNPVSDMLTIDCPSSGQVTVQIISSDGRLVFVQDFTSGNQMELNLASLAPGIYMVNLASGGKTASEKMVVR